MPRIQLRVYLDSGQAEIGMNALRSEGIYERLTAIIDTGAEICLLPSDLLDKLDYKLGERGTITVEQAGIARQTFTVTEAYVKTVLEDQYGARTREFELRVWFIDINKTLIGFDGILDHATLFIDMRQTRTGWIEIEQ